MDRSEVGLEHAWTNAQVAEWVLDGEWETAESRLRGCILKDSLSNNATPLIDIEARML